MSAQSGVLSTPRHAVKQILHERLKEQKAFAADLVERVHQQPLFTGIEPGSHFSVAICRWV